MSDSDLIAAFLAKNTVTVPEGMRTTTPREMHRAVRGESIDSQRMAKAEESYSHPVGDRCVVDHAGREFWMNAEGEWL